MIKISRFESMKRLAAGLAVAAVISGPVFPGPRTAFAAAGELPAALKALAAFEPGTDDAVLLVFQGYVRSCLRDTAAKSACEDALLAFLRGEATTAGRQAVCRELRIVGSEKSVPVLEKMLLAAETTDMARSALEGIPSEAAGAALTKALNTLRGDARLGVISSLGNMRYAPAAPALARLLPSSDEAETAAFAAALGRIGGPGAVSALFKVLGPSSSPSNRAAAASGLLACAEGLRAAGDDAGVEALYAKILSAKTSPAIRRAAVRGRIASSGPAAPAMIIAFLRAKDPESLQPAIDMIPAVFSGEAITDVCRYLPGLPVDAQIGLISVLSRYPRESVLQTLRTAAGESPLAAVRTAAIRALGIVGDRTCVGFLSDRAAGATGVEQAAARESLARVRGSDVDREILERLAAGGDTAVLGELIRAAGERRIAGCVESLTMLAGSDIPLIRSLALRAIRRTARGDDIGTLLGLLLDSGDESDREEIASAAAAVASRYAKPGAKAGAVESLLADERDPSKKASLLLVLGKIGEDRTLPLVRRFLAEAPSDIVSAAARALAAWPTPAARDDALAIARTSADPVLKVLALQGCVRMIGLERYRAPEGAAASLAEALALAQRPEEKRLILSALQDFPCPASLRIAESLLDSGEVGAEARAAVDAISGKLARKTS